MNPSLDSGASGSIRAGRRKLSGKIGCGRQLPDCSTGSSFAGNSGTCRSVDGIERQALGELRPEFHRLLRHGASYRRNVKRRSFEQTLEIVFHERAREGGWPQHAGFDLGLAGDDGDG